MSVPSDRLSCDPIPSVAPRNLDDVARHSQNETAPPASRTLWPTPTFLLSVHPKSGIVCGWPFQAPLPRKVFGRRRQFERKCAKRRMCVKSRTSYLYSGEFEFLDSDPMSDETTSTSSILGRSQRHQDTSYPGFSEIKSRSRSSSAFGYSSANRVRLAGRHPVDESSLLASPLGCR